MLGFAPLSATPLSALPVTGSSFAVETFGVISSFGTPNAIWDQLGGAAGFSTTQFGTPKNLLSQPVTGFAPAQFGTPTGYKLQRAESFNPVHFGTPSLYPSHVAPWPMSTQFGAPSSRQYWAVPSFGLITRFGTPTTPTDRTGQASGFAPVQFGTPVAVRHLPPGTDQLCTAAGFRTTGFGTPAAHWGQVGTVPSIGLIAHFGVPRAATTHHASGIAAVQFGTPTARLTQRASGFKPVAFGLAGAILTQRVSGIAPRTRFGTPRAVRSDWYEARGFHPTRFGTPRGYQRNNYRVSGFSPVQFGMPDARETHRAASIPPIAKFGTPLLKRITQC